MHELFDLVFEFSTHDVGFIGAYLLYELVDLFVLE